MFIDQIRSIRTLAVFPMGVESATAFSDSFQFRESENSRESVKTREWRFRGGFLAVARGAAPVLGDLWVGRWVR